MWVAHEDLLFGLEAHLIKLGRVIAAHAGTGWPTEAIIGEAFTVELKTSAFATVAGFIGHQQRPCRLSVALVGSCER